MEGIYGAKKRPSWIFICPLQLGLYKRISLERSRLEEPKQVSICLPDDLHSLSLDNVRKRPALCGQVQEGPNHLTVPRRLGSAAAFISPIWNKSMEHEVKFFLDVCIFMNRYLETNNLNRRRLHKVF